MKSLLTLTAVVLTLTSSTQAEQQDPFYEVLKSWQGAFHGNFCLTAPQDLFGWKIKIHFDQPVTSMRIWKAAVRTKSQNSTLYHVGDQFWNARWLTGERNCFDFTGTVPGVQTGAVASSIRFAGIVEPTGCPPQISGQQFSIHITRHWRHGMSGEFCWKVPRDSTGDWKIRVEFDQMLLRLVSPNMDTYNVNNRLHWLMTPKTGSQGQHLHGGEKFCLEFTAFTLQMINPCIRAFFTEPDGLSPITSSSGTGPSSTPVNPAPPTPTATSHTPTTSQRPTTQSVSTQTPTNSQSATTHVFTTTQAQTTPKVTTSTQAPSSQPVTTTSQKTSTTQVPQTTTAPVTQPTTTQARTAATSTTSAGSASSGWGGTYTELSVWDAGVNGRMCLDYTITPTCGWEVDLRFDPAVDSLDIWKAMSTGTTTEGSTNTYHLVNMAWNQAITAQPFCMDFNAYKSYKHGPKVEGRFTRICNRFQWTDIAAGSNGMTPMPQTSAPTPGAPPNPGPVMTGQVNQDMLDLYFSTYSGDGTYYGQGLDGACAYDQGDFPAVGLSSEIHALAALNYIKWYNSKACGMCFKVTGDGTGGGNDPLDGEYIVFIKDLCPQGACSLPGSVDFALNGDGRWEIDMIAVQCPVGNNKLQYTFQGSNPWYLKLQVSNYRIPPNEVSIQKNGVWKNMTKSLDGHWVLSDGEEMKNTNNIPVRVTAINGEQLTDTIPQLVNTQTMDGQQAVQFSFDPSLPSISSSPTNPTATPNPAPSAPGTSTPHSATQSTGPVKTGKVNQDMLDLYHSNFDGDGTYYGEGREGTCTYHQGDFPAVGLSSEIHALAALNYIKWYNSKACGMCFKVTGHNKGAGNDPLDGEYIVFIKDLCPQGACSLAGSVDFAENKDGRWDITIQAVQCPVGNNKLQYSFQGSNPWYIKLQVSNYRIPPNEVSIERNGVWETLTKSPDGYWLLSDGVEMKNTNNIPVRVTAINGEQLTDTIPQLVNTQTMDGQQAVQFSFDPSLPSISSSPTNPTATPNPAPSAPGTSTPHSATQSTGPVMTGRVNQDMLDLFSNSFAGDGTYYGEGRGGTCTYDQTDFPAVGLSSQIHALAALNHIKWYNSKACGMCFKDGVSAHWQAIRATPHQSDPSFEGYFQWMPQSLCIIPMHQRGSKVTGQGVGAGNDPLDGEYIVFIKDLCPQGACSKPGSVDFAENKDGRWDIEIQAVQCPVGNNKLQYAFQGTNPWYIKLQVSNYRIPPNEVSIERNGVWKALTKSPDGYWLLSDGVEMKNTNNIPVRVTAINGEQLTDSIPQLANNRVMDGGQGVQFSEDPTLPKLR